MLNADLNETQVGTVGEQLVRYKLLRWGHQAIQVEQGNDYDLIVVDGEPIKIQVKSTKRPDPNRPNTYKFSTKKGSYNNKSYEADVIDCFAFVALDKECIVFDEYRGQQCRRINKNDFTKQNGYDTWLAVLDKIKKKRYNSLTV